HAPPFAAVAGHVAERLRGRTFVAHNAQFDRRLVWHAFAALGYDVPVIEPTSLCTMRTGAQLFPAAPRSLAGACLHHGIALDAAHEALADARAAAELLRLYLARGARDTVPGWDDVVELAATTPWPSVPAATAEPVRRGVARERDTHFLARLADGDRRPVPAWAAEEYLGLVDRALLDRHISAREHDQLAALCARLGLRRADADALHRDYLAGLAAAAWSDGALDTAEATDVAAVAALLDVPAADAAVLLERAAPLGEGAPVPRAQRFTVSPGDLVVFTGATDEPRDVWHRRAAAAGLVPHGAVTRQVRLVVAADPDSLSGKARKAAAYGIPVISEAGFLRVLDELARPVRSTAARADHDRVGPPDRVAR